MPDVSVNHPATISLSASGRSKGTLSNSASEEIKNTNALIGRNKINQNGCCDVAICVRLSEPAKITTESAERMKGISKAIIWCNARNPPMNGYLLLLAHENSRAINGKNPSIANTAISPTFVFETTQPGATGINATTAAAVATNAIGAAQNIGLSAPDGIRISLEMTFKPSAASWSIPSLTPHTPAYNGPTLSCILARNLRSTNIVDAAIIAANTKPGNTTTLKGVW